MHAAGADLSITDEVPPYLWRGPQALQTWSADLESDAKKRGITDQVVTISPATREEMNGDQAYVVVPAVYTFKETRRGDARGGAVHLRAEEGRERLADPRLDVDGAEAQGRRGRQALSCARP